LTAPCGTRERGIDRWTGCRGVAADGGFGSESEERIRGMENIFYEINSVENPLGKRKKIS
jgi:hypothetical protein